MDVALFTATHNFRVTNDASSSANQPSDLPVPRSTRSCLPHWSGLFLCSHEMNNNAVHRWRSCATTIRHRTKTSTAAYCCMHTIHGFSIVWPSSNVSGPPMHVYRAHQLASGCVLRMFASIHYKVVCTKDARHIRRQIVRLEGSCWSSSCPILLQNDFPTSDGFPLSGITEYSDGDGSVCVCCVYKSVCNSVEEQQQNICAKSIRSSISHLEYRFPLKLFKFISNVCSTQTPHTWI